MEHTHTIFGGNKELNIINYCRNINQETQDKKKIQHIQNQTKMRRETRNIYITSKKQFHPQSPTKCLFYFIIFLNAKDTHEKKSKVYLNFFICQQYYLFCVLM